MRARPRPSRTRGLLARALTGEGMAAVRCAAGSVLLVRPRSVVDVAAGLCAAGAVGAVVVQVRDASR